MDHRRGVVASLTGGKPSFVEVYGRGSIVDMAQGPRRDLNISGLNALDIRTRKPNGQKWDFNKASDRQEARRLVIELEPTWLIGSPPCTVFSSLQNLNFSKMPKEKVKEILEEGRRHLHFVVSLYRLQLSHGRHFLHEHPCTAASWRDPWVQKLTEDPRVHVTVSDQCEYGLRTPDKDGNLVLAMKPTKRATSSIHIASRRSKRCTGTHKHQHLVGGSCCSCSVLPECLNHRDP